MAGMIGICVRRRAARALGVCVAAGAAAAIGFGWCAQPAKASYVFQNVVNPGDVTFNQELGINNAGTIAGYFGSGCCVVHDPADELDGGPAGYARGATLKPGRSRSS